MSSLVTSLGGKFCLLFELVFTLLYFTSRLSIHFSSRWHKYITKLLTVELPIQFFLIEEVRLGCEIPSIQGKRFHLCFLSVQILAVALRTGSSLLSFLKFFDEAWSNIDKS